MTLSFIKNYIQFLFAGFSPHRNAKSKTLHSTGLFLSLLAIGLFDLQFFNRYFPLSEGWFSLYARFMDEGFLPYRDFHLFLTPLHQLLICVFIKNFGYSIFYLRVLGFILALIMTALIYAICMQFYDAPAAFVGAVFGMIYYQSSVVFINYDFLQFLTTYALLACWLICQHFRPFSRGESDRKSKVPWRIWMAGIFAGMAFLTKQSNGFFVAGFIGLSVIIAAASIDRRTAIGLGVWFSFGVLLPLIVIWLWLQSHGLWSPFIQNTFFGGAASKGGIGAVVFGWIPRLLTFKRILGLCVALIIFAFWVMEGLWKSREKLDGGAEVTPFREIVQLWVAFVISLACILFPYLWMPFSYSIQNHFHLNLWHALLSIVGTVFALAIMFYGLYVAYHNRRRSVLPLLIVGTISTGFFLGNGTSAAIDMAGVFLPIALLVGFVLTTPIPARWMKTAIGLLGCALMLYMCSQKYTTPFIWWGLSQSDVRRVVPIQGIPGLKGMETSIADNSNVLLNIIELARKFTRNGDSLYTFPHMAQINLLTRRYPTTYAVVHWFDVASDQVALHDAEILQNSPPKMFAFLDIPDVVWSEHEKGFRQGRPCGQQEIRRTLVRLIHQGRYKLLLKRMVPDQNMMTVWVRSDYPVTAKESVRLNVSSVTHMGNL